LWKREETAKAVVGKLPLAKGLAVTRLTGVITVTKSQLGLKIKFKTPHTFFHHPI
jgi:hypothetical protein